MDKKYKNNALLVTVVTVLAARHFFSSVREKIFSTNLIRSSSKHAQKLKMVRQKEVRNFKIFASNMSLCYVLNMISPEVCCYMFLKH